MLINFNYLKEKYLLDIKGVIHIGAHYGDEVASYVENGIENILLFEPLKDNFNILFDRVRFLKGDIRLRNVALGSHVHTTKMYVSDNEKQSSSILKPKVHLSHHPNVQFPSMEEVNVDLLDNYSSPKYNFINMDVQGYELEVLKGAKETLKNIDYIYCEVNRDELYEGNAYIQDIDNFLSQYNMVRVETDWSGGLWGDAFYVKNKSTYEKCLSETKFNANDKLIFVDVGCNINPVLGGTLDDFTELALRKYPNSSCVGIEPLHWQSYAEKWKDDNRVSLIKNGLWNNEEQKILYVPSVNTEMTSHGLSSLFNRECFKDYQNYIIEHTIDCITLDSLIQKYNLDIIDYLKIDTEGAEFPILQGSSNALKNKKIKYIQLEYGGTYNDAGYNIQSVIDYLRLYSYELIYSSDTSSGEMLFSVR